VTDLTDDQDDENERELARASELGLLFTFHVAVDGPPPVDRAALGWALLGAIRPDVFDATVRVEDVGYTVTGLGITYDKGKA
jgi:hypothetical protein